MKPVVTWLRRIPLDVRLFLAILGVLLPLRIYQTLGITTMSVDGGYYTEVAAHVRDGLGLTSHVSLYHAGVEHFPFPTSVYPLWPWMLGMAAKVGDLDTLAHWLPLALGFTALVGLFLFGRRLWPEPLFPDAFPGFGAAHAFVLVLATQRDFTYFTSLPYTEGISFTLLFFFFWRLFVRGPSLSLAWALELGAWTGLLYLARAQFVVAGIAVAGAFAVRAVVGPDRGRAALCGGVATLVFAAVLGAWWLHLSTFVYRADLGTLLRFDQNRANGLLTPFDVIVADHGLLDVLRDRLTGVLYAWDVRSDTSYQAVFFTTHWALPLAVPFLLAAGVAALRTKGPRALLDALRRPDAVAWMVLLATALGGLLSVHLAHKHYNGEWYFDRRQSLVCVVAFLLPLGWLLRRDGRVPRALGLIVLVSTTVLGAHNLYTQARDRTGELHSKDKYAEILTWMRRRVAAEGPLTMAVYSGAVQRLAWRTHDVGYQWFYEETSYDDLLKMTDQLGAKYVIASGQSLDWRFAREGAGRIDQDFETLPEKPNGLTILARRHVTFPPVPHQKVVVVGVDGASWKVIGPLLDRGELPTFAKLMHDGAHLSEFDTLSPTDSPVIWTTVATGKYPKDHGVTDYTQDLDGVGKVPVTSNARKVPALWNVATDAGDSVAVINWWASWPAEQVNGVIVTDHANPASAGWMQGKYWSADTDALRALQHDTWPADLAAQLTGRWLDPDHFPWDDFQARAGLTPEQLTEARNAAFNERNTYSWLKTFYAVDAPHVDIALDQLRAGGPDLLMLYLRGPDPIQHYAWDTVEPNRYAHVPGTSLGRDKGVVDGVYRYVDSFLAEVMAACGPDTTLIVMSDHGGEPVASARDPHRTGRPGGHTKTAKGVLFYYGPSVKPGVTLSKAGPADIAPTIAWLLGLPVAADLPGRVMTEAFTRDFRERRGRASVPTWGTRTADTPVTASPADANMMKQLQGLGYIE